MKQRILYTMKIFLEQTDEEHGKTVSEIAEMLKEYGFDADRRSIYSDIEALNSFGMDIVSSRGKRHEYFLVSRTFELPELKLLVDAVQSSKFITEKKSRELIGKLESLTSEYMKRQLSRSVYVKNRVKTMNESIYYNVDILENALNENKKISFVYSDYDLDKKLIPRHNGERYIVSPFMLTWDDENYYMIAFHDKRGDMAHFRVDKMGKIQMLEEDRKEFEEIDRAEYLKSTFGMFGGENAGVNVWFDISLIGVVIDRFGKDVNIISSDEKGFEAKLSVNISPVFFAWIFQFGKRAKILSPENVKEKFKELLEESLEN